LRPLGQLITQKWKLHLKKCKRPFPDLRANVQVAVVLTI
jgi:hypothetical protein